MKRSVAMQSELSCLSCFIAFVLVLALLYAAPIWVAATGMKWCRNKLRSVQRLMLVTIIRSFKSISSLSALILSNSLPMEMRAQTLAIQSIIKNSFPFSPLISNIVNFLKLDPNVISNPCIFHLKKLPPFSITPFDINLTNHTIPAVSRLF